MDLDTLAFNPYTLISHSYARGAFIRNNLIAPSRFVLLLLRLSIESYFYTRLNLSVDERWPIDLSKVSGSYLINYNLDVVKADPIASEASCYGLSIKGGYF